MSSITLYDFCIPFYFLGLSYRNKISIIVIIYNPLLLLLKTTLITSGKDDFFFEDLKTHYVVNVYPNMYKLL